MNIQNKLENLLDLSFDNIPNSSFFPCSASENSTGNAVIKFEKEVMPKIFNLFDKIEINTFLDTEKKNIILTSTNFEFISLNFLELLVEKLYNFYGNDSIGSSKISQFDFQQIRSGYWSGRLWTDHEKYEIPILLAYDKEEGLSLTIFYQKNEFPPRSVE
ncbi:hypothetical protein J0A67_08100 [Algoriphagus aestuariicola]|uniref:Uncharacterized protein n=1 Tax=Algoriphagus aestuariicola TaxID=1852016 RepID=A0ABS3BNC0_9BACT|nr:hypothetical protein [Algoriphagus aestuariicola]MBN7800818.1 hypothetical protein [Algoriphagus aestuariicola]